MNASDGEQVTTMKQAMALVDAGRRAADSIWAQFFHVSSIKPGAVAAAVAARNPGVKPSLWAGIVDGLLNDYRTNRDAEPRYRAYLGFDSLQ